MSRGKKVQAECDECGGNMTVRVADRARGWAKYCSKRCKALAQGKLERAWERLGADFRNKSYTRRRKRS